MCAGCGKVWTALQVLWSTVYVICGAAQLIAGIFFLISLPIIHLHFNIITGSWNIIMGIGGGMLSCLGQFTPRRQEFLLYIAASILTINCVNVIVNEWGLYFTDMSVILKNHPNHILIDYACFATRIATATVILVSFIDTQFAFCSMQIKPSKTDKKKIHGSHEQVSDIEYIIPRPKSTKPHTTVYNAYSQSWVFEADTGNSSTNNVEAPYLKIIENGTPDSKKKVKQNGIVKEVIETHLIDNPVVHIEEASDDSNSNSDRKLCHMRSFSRSASPILLSESSSHISLNQTNNNPPIYECLESIYRTRLNTGGSTKDETHYQAPQTMVMRRIESVSPQAEKVQYASLMKELQKAIGNKKESNITSPLSGSDSATASEKTQTDSKSSSRHESSRSDCKSSDAEFSKELEAALQLIQDLESPNTIDTPSEPKGLFDGKESRPLVVWRNSDASESEKTLSAVGSFTEIASPLTECQPELYTFKPPNKGKGSSIIIRYPDSQSTSGYSSPTHASNGETPSWSTTSSLNGSNDIIPIKPLSYSIHNAKSTTVISLYSQTSPQSKGKSVTLVNICGDTAPIIAPQTQDEKQVEVKPLSQQNNNNKINTNNQQQQQPTVWKSLLRKKKQSSLPKLCPELEGAIIKSESLAYLSEIELLARHQRNKEIQREIEERVIQQLGTTPRTETNC